MSTPGFALPSAAYPPRVRRRVGGRVLGGVAGGVADHTGFSVLHVRLVFVVLAALGGAGVVGYGLLWICCPPGTDTVPASKEERRVGWLLIGLCGGALALEGAVASGTPAAYLVPLLVVAVGAAVVWREFDVTATRTARMLVWTRITGGATLVLTGLVVMVVDRTDLAGLGTALVAALATLAGVVLLTVPLWMRLVQALGAERAARIRTAEREEIASHLHDSVLQTLALIQKRSGDPEQVQRLARSQERELRRYLFGDPAAAAVSFAALLAAAAAEVEDGYGIDVDVVTVGDAPLGADFERESALVQAAREALVNAAKHAEVKRVDVYSEVAPDRIEVFVRDRGVGFDRDAVADDRQGLTRSIEARVRRRGGEVRVKSAPGAGTEVSMVMPMRGEEAS